MRNIDWIKELKNGSAQCYIKPNRLKHDSGYRCFEVGYLMVGKNTKMKEKLVLGKYSDHIQSCGYGYDILGKLFLVNIDLLLDGYIRLWTHEYRIWWGSLEFVVSSAQLVILEEIRKKDETKKEENN